MATPRDPSRVREAKPYGPALDCSFAVAKTSTRLNKANGLKSLGRKGTFLLGYRGGHFYWATTRSAKTVASRLWIGYPIRAGWPKRKSWCKGFVEALL